MKQLPIFLFALLAFSCSSDSDDKEQNDVGTADLSQDLGPKKDASTQPDMDADVGKDLGEDSGSDLSEDMPKNDVIAVHGARCEPKDLVGLVTVERRGNLNVQGNFADRPNPRYGDATLKDVHCSFFENEPAMPCPDSCPNDELCGVSGQCMPIPNLATDGMMTITNGVDSETIETENGSLSDSLTMTGDSFSMEVSWMGQKVRLETMTVPGEFTEIIGNLEGGYDSPDGLDLSWTAPANTARAFTHIPMNHHVPKPTFVQCEVDAASEKMRVEGEMLRPLSVSTGLEFQTLNHIRFAAAESELGCVEFRYQIASFVNL